MPGLKQVALLAYEYLKILLALYRYHPIPSIIGLQKYETRPTIFYLYIDDFGIKLWLKSDANHLCNAISIKFKYTINLKGKNYCGLILDWNYAISYIDISIPKYILVILKKLFYELKVSQQY